MADHPKTLQDLRSIDARVRLRCRQCGAEEDHERELLIRRAGSRSPVQLEAVAWSCGRASCDGQAVFAEAVPWCDDPAELRRRVNANTLLNLSCRVLKNAAYRRAKENEQQTPVRLALRVVQAFGVEAKICTAFWTKVTAPSPSPWDGCHDEVNWIVLALLRAGWSIDAELR